MLFKTTNATGTMGFVKQLHYLNEKPGLVKIQSQLG